jgi:CRISPR-associated protein Csd1
MILQALKHYYDRLAAESDAGEIPMLGFARQKIHFCIVLNTRGDLVDVNSLQVMEGKRLIAPEIIVPEPVKRTVGMAANFLWDNTGYVLGADLKEKPERLCEKSKRFRELQKEVAGNLEDAGMRAVILFLDKWDPQDVPRLKYWKEMAGLNVVFRLDGESRFVHEGPQVRSRWISYSTSNSSELVGMCLVTGDEGPVARLHQSIKGVPGSQTSGASLVSFNLDSFTSYGKEQNFNAPIGEQAAFAYCTALNWLLRKSSRQKITLGETAVVFWTERRSEAESLFADLFDTDLEIADTGPDDKGALADLRIIFEAASHGRLQDAVKEPDTAFYILGLSPNASRLSVRFWSVSTVRDVVNNLCRHFEQLEIVRSFDNEPKYPSARTLLRETVSKNDPGKAWEKDEKVSPLLAGGFLQSILTGHPYPESLLPVVLMRIRSDQTINYLRASILKACLVRNYAKEVSVSLDKNNTNIGYRLGRLFAVFERIQAKANPGINSTIRDKYFGSAAATPQGIFPMLWTLSQQHMGKLSKDKETKGLAKYFDSKIEGIASTLEANPLPSHLNPESQGMFFLGYYHQRQDLFRKTEQKQDEEE